VAKARRRTGSVFIAAERALEARTFFGPEVEAAMKKSKRDRVQELFPWSKSRLESRMEKRPG